MIAQHLMNAAGWCKTPGPVFNDILRSPATEITIGSYTCEPRDGNPGHTYAEIGEATINALGLPNPGIAAVEQFLPDLLTQCHRAGKRLRVSIAGTGSPGEYAQLAAFAAGFAIDTLEVNVGCPNVIEGGHRKTLISYDPAALDRVLAEVSNVVPRAGSGGPRIALKLSPLAVMDDVLEYRSGTPLPRMDQQLATQLLGIIGPWKTVHELVVCNTLPHVRPYYETGVPVLDTPDGAGGLGGAPLRPLTLEHVSWFRRRLGSAYRITACGGLQTGEDVSAAAQVGAHAAQIGSAWMQRSARIFSDVAHGLVA